MRFIADENIPRAVVESLRSDGHDVVWVRTHHPGWRDTQILELAEEQSRILLTLDGGFWQIAVQRKVPLQNAGVVLLRVHPATVANLLPLVRILLDAGLEWPGTISVIEPTRIQTIPAARP